MAAIDINDQLERVASDENFVGRSYELTDAWSAADTGVEIIEPILRFMEEHPSIDFGAPGPLVHFVERFYGKGYEEKLIESIKRKPTAHTVWMLNRVINGTSVPDTKRLLVTTMRQARLHPLVDQGTLEEIDQFLQIGS
jgi:hypothetical protein